MRQSIDFMLIIQIILYAQNSRTIAFQPCLSSSRLSLKLNASTERNSRRSLFKSVTSKAACLAASVFSLPKTSEAAPPIAIIAEELGYFPVTNREGSTVYIPGKVRRKSTEQSIRLARHLKSVGATMYGTYWCPHCGHQKELFGSEAWSIIPYAECATKGFYYDANKINAVRDKVEGFPTWHFPKSAQKKKGNEWVSGEMPLERIAILSGFSGDFDVSLGSCKSIQSSYNRIHTCIYIYINIYTNTLI